MRPLKSLCASACTRLRRAYVSVESFCALVSAQKLSTLIKKARLRAMISEKKQLFEILGPYIGLLAGLQAV